MWDLSSLTRDQTYVPGIRRQILNHQATREVPHLGVPDPLPTTLCLAQMRISINVSWILLRTFLAIGPPASAGDSEYRTYCLWSVMCGL